MPRRGSVAGGSRRGRLARLGCAERASRRLNPFQRRRRRFPPPFSPCCDCYGAALGRGSGGRRAGAPRCVPAGGSGDSGTAPPGSPCRCHPAPLPPPQGEGAARKALNGGPGSAGAAGLIKHCICIALRYPPDWSCSERRIIYCGSRVLSAATAWRDGGGGRGVERPPQPLEEQRWQPALLGGAQIKDQERKKNRKKILKKKAAYLFLWEYRSSPPGKIFRQDRLCPLPFPSASTSVCVNCKLPRWEPAGEDPPASPRPGFLYPASLNNGPPCPNCLD